MPTIDADAHVIESERTWDYIEDDKLRPFLSYAGREIEALRKFKGMGEVEPRVIDKILYDNAKALYGL